MKITFPLFVRAKDSGEVRMFNSTDALQFQVEKTDIENKEYEAWDAEGYPIELMLQEPAWLALESTGTATDPEGLRRAIVEFGESLGMQIQRDLPTSLFVQILSQITRQYQSQKLAKSRVRRFLSRFKHDTV